MEPIRDSILAKVSELPGPPVAFEAQWDGDSEGWCLDLGAILGRVTGGYVARSLGLIRDGGDLRLFNGQVPPWGETRIAREIGEELSARFGVPFYFPSPDHPEDECPHWWEQERGYPCRRCGVMLLQRSECPWRGVCFFCHLAEQRERREAAWTPAERAGPRCHLCGDPATGMLGGAPACTRCLGRYDAFVCASCGAQGIVPKVLRRSDRCPRCDLRSKLADLSDTDRRTIQGAIEKGDGSALRTIQEVLDVTLYDAIPIRANWPHVAGLRDPRPDKGDSDR